MPAGPDAIAGAGPDGSGGGLRCWCRRSRLAWFVKRVIDLCISVPLCVLLSPLFILTGLAIKLDSHGPVFFLQRRRGKGFRPFWVIKFRSLQHNAPDPHDRYEMQESDPRITRVGAILRRSSLDELPQLFNVLWGSMSLVGPRPLNEAESQECLPNYSERFEMKPGITGLSQVEVRNSVGFCARLDKDVEYVRRWGLLLDLRILLETPLVLIRGAGLYPQAKEQGA